MRTRFVRTVLAAVVAGCALFVVTTSAVAGHPVVGGCHIVFLKTSPGDQGGTCTFIGATLPGMPGMVSCKDIPASNGFCTVTIRNMQSGAIACQVGGPKPLVAPCPPLQKGKIYTCSATWNKQTIGLKDVECAG
jgi:hypothetical protein